MVEIFIIYSSYANGKEEKGTGEFFFSPTLCISNIAIVLRPLRIASKQYYSNVGMWNIQCREQHQSPQKGKRQRREKENETEWGHFIQIIWCIAFLMKLRFTRNRNIYFPQYHQFLLSHSISIQTFDFLWSWLGIRLFRCFLVSILKRFTACDSTSSITGITCAFVKYAYRNIASVSVWLYAGAKNKCQIHFFGFDFFIAKKNYNIGFSVKPMMCMEKMWPHVALSVWMLSGKIDVSIYHKEYLARRLERVVFPPN